MPQFQIRPEQVLQCRPHQEGSLIFFKSQIVTLPPRALPSLRQLTLTTVLHMLCITEDVGKVDANSDQLWSLIWSYVQIVCKCDLVLTASAQCALRVWHHTINGEADDYYFCGSEIE